MWDSKWISLLTLHGPTVAVLFGAVLVAGPAAAEPVVWRMCVAPAAAAVAPDDKATLRVPIWIGAGQRAYIDPDSGQLIAPPEAEKQLLEASMDEMEAFSYSAADLTSFRTAQGARVVHLGGRFQVGEFATLGPDGGVVMTDSWTATPPPIDSKAAKAVKP